MPLVLFTLATHLGCTWRNTSRGTDIDLSTARVSNPVFDGIYGTFGADGAIPLFDQHSGSGSSTGMSRGLVLGDRLTLPTYVDGVLERHPTIEAAVAAIEAADERHPQVTALQNPQFRFLTGPTLFGTNDGMQLWRLQAQQPLEGWGKRGWRGRIAQEQASGASQDLSIARRKLRQTAIRAYFDLAMIEAVGPLVHADHEAARQEFAAKQLQLVSNSTADIGEAEQLELDRIELDKTVEEFHWLRLAALQQANLLLGRDSQERLPPPAPPAPPRIPWEEEELLAYISPRHPELLRANAQCREAEAIVELARCQFHPDFHLVGRFDTTADQFWLPDRAFIRPQLGFNVNMPLRKDSLEAGIREAQANLRKSRAEREAVEKEIHREVTESLADLQRMHHNLERVTKLSELARKKKEQFDRYEGDYSTDPAEQIKAHRQWLKYEIERVKTDFALRHRVLEIHYEINPHFHSPTPPDPVIEGLPPVYMPPQQDDWALRTDQTLPR